jgi:hypothetical protein
MKKIVALSSESHVRYRWTKYSNYSFVAEEAVLPLVAAELSKSIMSLPVAFIRQGEQYELVALLGLETGKNLFVSQDGRWIGQYVPAAARSYPFMLARNEKQEFVLCFDEQSGLINDSVDGESLFTEESKPSQGVEQILSFLDQIEQSRQATVTACAALEKQACIVPWNITLKTAEGERKIEGLFQIDEAALNALDAEAFIELRKAGAIIVAYCQLLSMQHLPVLGQLAEVRLPPVPVSENGKDLDLSFLSDGGVFNFSGI